LELAAKVKDIDLIAGGHSHTLPAVYPTVVGTTLVVQAEAYGKYLGRLNLSFDEQGVIRKYSGGLSLIKDAAEDPGYTAVLAKYSAPIDELKNTIIGKTLLDLDGERADVRTKETNFGDLVADAMLSRAHTLKADAAIVNGGSIRTTIKAGDVSLGQILEAIPFNNDLVAVDITGDQLAAALENGVSQAEAVSGRFPQVAGIKFTWDPTAKPQSRIRSVEVMSGGGYQPLSKSATYRVVTNGYMFTGGDGYTSFQKGTNIEYLGFIDYDIVKDYIQQNSPVNPSVDGRITAIK